MTGDASRAPFPELQPELLAWFDAWKACTQNVLSQISGQPQTFALSAEPFKAADSDLRYTVAAAGAVQGEMALRLPLASATWLAHKFVGEAIAQPSPTGAAGGTGALSNDDREALEELLRQIAELAPTALGSVAGGEFQLQLSSADAPWAATADALSTLCSRDEDGAEIAIEIRLSPALVAALAARSPAAPASSVASPPAPAASPPPPGAPGYHRLFDVGLGVKLRFGTRRMLLRDVLALSTGLVVELDNAVNSPVDLLLEGRVIARGEVVVIDGKYGLRVTEVLDPPPVPAPMTV